jgi:methionyl aminopeptidase
VSLVWNVRLIIP